MTAFAECGGSSGPGLGVAVCADVSLVEIERFGDLSFSCMRQKSAGDQSVFMLLGRW